VHLGLALLAAAASVSPVSVRFEAAYLHSAGGDVARGGGIGLGAAFRLSDQISVVAGASQNVVWLRDPLTPAAPRASRSLTLLSAGLFALLDATPVAPFLELTLVRAGQEDVAGYTFAARTALGADFRFLPAWALGLAVRTQSPLDSPGGVTALGGTEVAARLVWTPAF
jgi:hypothetical protein